MFRGLLAAALLGHLLLCAGAYHKLTGGQDSLERATLRLRAQSLDHKRAAYQRFLALSAEAKRRAQIYEELITNDHLADGLLVHRHHDGRAASECDSLLFSSLRYVALGKLGWHDRANEAWKDIEEKAFENGRWLRHPNCRRKTTSRDMVVGLMAALTQSPAHDDAHIRNLLAIIERTAGSVDEGPFYVSRMSPGMGEILKALARREGIPEKHWPEALRISFTTLEFDTWWAVPGYTSHLQALTLWSEMELSGQNPDLKFRTLTQLLDGLLKPIVPHRLSEQRRNWAAQSLVAVDPGNLFFEYLALRAAGALTYSTRTRLLEKLLTMEQFPIDRLPQDCDRRADYLWQRSSVEYTGARHCNETFHGTDFLWMAALLSEDENPPNFAHR